MLRRHHANLQRNRNKDKNDSGGMPLRLLVWVMGD